MCLKTLVLFMTLVVCPPLAAHAQAEVCPVSAFGGARTLLSRVPTEERLITSGAAGVPSERWAAFDRVVGAILGADADGADEQVRRAFVAALDTDPPGNVACDRGMIERDRSAYRLALVGYSAGDIARMLNREASRAQIDDAYARRMAGYPPVQPTVRTAPVEITTPIVLPAPVSPPLRLLAPAMPRPSGVGPARSLGSMDAYIRHYARSYQVDDRLVTAMIRQESNWNAAAVSPKGAIGLMQLMPATASMLRVNPRDPLENLRGGIAYLAGLIRTYGSVRNALIAYNAGPVHANQVIRGERALYGETRRYLKAIAATYPIGNDGIQ